jgi:hypothetical protein
MQLTQDTIQITMDLHSSDSATLTRIVDLIIAHIDHEVFMGLLVKGKYTSTDEHVIDEDTVNRIVDAVLVQMHLETTSSRFVAGMSTGSSMVRGSNDLNENALEHIWNNVVDQTKKVLHHDNVVTPKAVVPKPGPPGKPTPTPSYRVPEKTKEERDAAMKQLANQQNNIGYVKSAQYKKVQAVNDARLKKAADAQKYGPTSVRK